MHEKLKIYRRNQVPEYLAWRVYNYQFDCFRLQQGEYIQVTPNADDIIYSQISPGLWLDRTALLGENLAKVLDVVQQGLAS